MVFTIRFCLFPSVFIKTRIKGVEIFRIEPVLNKSQALTESLKMHDLSGSEEFDYILYVGVISKTENIIINSPCLLFCCNGKSATFANKINPIGFILYHIPLKTEYITIFARKLYHILPLAKYITKNSNVLLSEHRSF